MDAVKYIEEKERMCGTFRNCDGCPIWKSCDPNAEDAKETVAAVEKWSREHPRMTNGDKIMDLIPVMSRLTNYTSEDYVHMAIAKDWWYAPYEEE